MLFDYRQAMDIAGLSKLSGDTITLIVGILGFLVSPFSETENVPSKCDFSRNSDLR